MRISNDNAPKRSNIIYELSDIIEFELRNQLVAYNKSNKDFILSYAMPAWYRTKLKQEGCSVLNIRSAILAELGYCFILIGNKAYYATLTEQNMEQETYYTFIFTKKRKSFSQQLPIRNIKPTILIEDYKLY